MCGLDLCGCAAHLAVGYVCHIESVKPVLPAGTGGQPDAQWSAVTSTQAFVYWLLIWLVDPGGPSEVLEKPAKSSVMKRSRFWKENSIYLELQEGGVPRGREERE